jgi:hypothetical protein
VVSDLPPVEENIERTQHASQTFLDRFSLCPRSAYLYRKHEGGPRSHAMDRGVLIHAVFEKQLRLMVEQGEHYVPPELAKDLAAELLAERTDLVVPPGEADAVRLMAFHLAEGIAIDPSTVVAIEDTFELPLGDFILRGRIDAAFLPEKDRLVVWDLKSSLAVPNQEDFEHSFQHPFYAVLSGGTSSAATNCWTIACTWKLFARRWRTLSSRASGRRSPVRTARRARPRPCVRFPQCFVITRGRSPRSSRLARRLSGGSSLLIRRPG